MSGKRQNNQLRLAFDEESRSEAPQAPGGGSETLTAKRMFESPARHEQLMEEVCERENCLQAFKRVKSNKGSPGIDGMTVDALSAYLKEHWPAIREQLLAGTYKPQPVKRVEIPKPDGGVRQLGIPTVLDRMVQQAVMQVLQGRWDAEFSEHSHGFRPGRSAHQAIAKAQKYIAEGHRWVVDLDLEKFFDRVNHDKLMASIARRVAQHLRSQPAGRGACEAEHYLLHRAAAQAQGQRSEECGGPTGGSKVPGLQLYGRRTTEAAYSPQGCVALQAESRGVYWPDTGCQYRADDEGTDQLLAWLEGLLRLLRNALGAGEPGSMDTAQAAFRDLAAMEAGPLRSTTPTGRSESAGHDHRCE